MKNIALSCIFTAFLGISMSVSAHIDVSHTKLEGLLPFLDPVMLHAPPSHSERDVLNLEKSEMTTYHPGTLNQVAHAHYPGLNDLNMLDAMLLTGWRFVSTPRISHSGHSSSTIGEYMKHHGKQTYSLLSSRSMASERRFGNRQSSLDIAIIVLTGLGLMGLSIALRGNRG